MSIGADIANLGVAALYKKYRAGALSPVDVIDSYESRIAEFNPLLNAFLELRLDAARSEAHKSAERWKDGNPLSPIDGVPFGVKANIALEGSAFHGGIAAYADQRATKDAPCIVNLKNAGAIPLGILNMHEGALGATTNNPHFGKCANPWREDLTPGGSSGGSGAAVAAGLCAFSLGTDTMGSVRIPSAYCGIAGHKPTYGLVPAEELIDLSPTLDHVGPHALSAEDLALILPSLADQFSFARSERRLRIGVADWGEAVEVSPEVFHAFNEATTLIASFADIQKIDLSAVTFGALRRKGLLISEAEGAAFHAEKLQENPQGFSDEFRSLLEWGAAQSDDKIDHARTMLSNITMEVENILSSVDVLVLPTAPQLPFRFSDPVPANQADFTALANFGGFPSTAIPATIEGTPPASIQFMAGRRKDALALSAAISFEEVRGAAPKAPGYF